MHENHFEDRTQYLKFQVSAQEDFELDFLAAKLASHK